jgi:hypothetical protein
MKTRPAHHLAGVHTRDAPYSARRGPRRRAQTWRALFIAPCALREAHGRGASWRACGGRVQWRLRFQPLRGLFMNNPSSER